MYCELVQLTGIREWNWQRRGIPVTAKDIPRSHDQHVGLTVAQNPQQEDDFMEASHRCHSLYR